jgi:hypothetical protein
MRVPRRHRQSIVLRNGCVSTSETTCGSERDTAASEESVVDGTPSTERDDQGKKTMGDFALTNLREARAAHSSLQQFLEATRPVTKAPNAMFKAQVKAEAHVWARQYARSEGGGFLDNAIAHLEHGTNGPWTEAKLATLRADRLTIGDGLAPTLVGDVRAHVLDAVTELDAAIQAKSPGPMRLAGYGLAAAAVVTLGGFAWHNHD